MKVAFCVDGYGQLFFAQHLSMHQIAVRCNKIMVYGSELLYV